MAANRLWNANIHYHPLILAAIPQGAQRVLDVGCGDGILSAQLVEAGVRRVVALDADAGVLERARTRHLASAIEWMHADLFAASFAAESFDAVVSVATVHHLDAVRSLARFAELVRPSGVVAVIGLAANDWWDWPYAAVAQGARGTLGVIRGHWEHTAPMAWPPPETYGEMKRIARRALPGVRYRRHLLGRYSLIWTKPS